MGDVGSQRAHRRSYTLSRPLLQLRTASWPVRPAGSGRQAASVSMRRVWQRARTTTIRGGLRLHHVNCQMLHQPICAGQRCVRRSPLGPVEHDRRRRLQVRKESRKPGCHCGTVVGQRVPVLPRLSHRVGQRPDIGWRFGMAWRREPRRFDDLPDSGHRRVIGAAPRGYRNRHIPVDQHRQVIHRSTRASRSNAGINTPRPGLDGGPNGNARRPPSTYSNLPGHRRLHEPTIC